MGRAVAKLSRNGQSQAVRLPKGCRFAGDEVYVEKDGDTLVLTPKQRAWSEFFSQAPLPSEDFLKTREDLLPQRRDVLV